MTAHEDKYKANYQYKIYLIAGVIFILVSGVFFLFENSVSTEGILFSFFSFLAICILWLVPYEIVVNKDDFFYKTLFRKKRAKFSTVKKITVSYSTKSMIWYGGDKSKANMMCYIWFSSNPADMIVINGSLDRYHELCSRLEENLKKEKRGRVFP